MSLVVEAVPVLDDNFSYIVYDGSSADKPGAIIDAAEPQKVLSKVADLGVKVTHVLTTHHHGDHSGGNEELRSLLPSIPVVGGKGDHVPGATLEVDQGDSIELGQVKLQVLSAPCHTSGHVLYFGQDSTNKKVLFTGDTLFIAGCGKFFEGTAEQMNKALNDTVAGLPEDTEIYCGHEYTVSNLKFAIHAEPDNQDVRSKLEWAEKTRSEGKFTIPSTIAEEKKTNPFMRVNEKSIQAFTKTR
jgi:hydroxyacylglutathione hydrolase